VLELDVPSQLLAGYRRFREERFAGEAERYLKLAREQRPRTMVIGCADSRVDPATIFSAAPGELFVVRNVAALIPPFEENGTYHGTSAALEFAVSVLGVESIVVLGHGLCGGIAAALSVAENRPVGRFIRPWVDLIADVRDAVVADLGNETADARQNALEHLAVRQSLRNLESFPFIAAEIEARRLALHGAWFSIAQGELHWLDRARNVFEPVQI
jgi:carbonic anhydrase